MPLDPRRILSQLKQAEPLVNCGEEFDVAVEHSMQVANCGSYSNDEEDRMTKALIREWRTKAQAQCDELNSCPYPEPTDVRELDNSCHNNVWTVKWSVKTKCTS